MAEIKDPEATGEIEGLPILDVPVAQVYYSARVAVPHFEVEDTSDPQDDGGQRGKGNRLIVVSLIGGVAAVCLFVGASVGVALSRRNEGVGDPQGQQTGVQVILSDKPASPTPSATPSPTPSAKASASPVTPASTTTPATTVATTSAPAGPNYECRIIADSEGRQVYIKGGKAYPIANAAVSACVSVRSGAGAPVPVSDGVYQGYPRPGTTAHCAYETQTSPGRLNFVTEDGGWVWLVDASGVRHHVGSLCSTAFTGYAYEVHRVPTGETDGHATGGDWFADDSKCAGLPH
jgi:hypothetical protein